MHVVQRVHRAVITNDVVFIRCVAHGWNIPGAGQLHVRFNDFLAVDGYVAVVKTHLFIGQTDHSFHEHGAFASHADSHDIPSLRRVKQIGQEVDEVEAVRLVGRQHADALDVNGKQHEEKNDEGSGHQDDDANSGPAWPPPDEHSLQQTCGLRLC